MSRDKLVTAKEVTDVLCCRANKLYYMVAKGKFPPPVKVARSSFWPEEEVTAMVAAWSAGISEEELKAFVAFIVETRKTRFQALQQSMAA